MKILKGLLTGALLATSSAPFCVAWSPAQLAVPQQVSQAEWCAQHKMVDARNALENANRLFSTGDAKAAHAAIDLTLTGVQSSVDCSLQAHTGKKDEEIGLRELIRRFKDISQTLDFEDRPHLTQVRLELEEQHDRMLNAIFGAAFGTNTAENKASPAEKKQ